jgi:hypothetical protein
VESLFHIGWTKQNLRSIIHGKQETRIKTFASFFVEETDFLPSRDKKKKKEIREELIAYFP